VSESAGIEKISNRLSKTNSCLGRVGASPEEDLGLFEKRTFGLQKRKKAKGMREKRGSEGAKTRGEKALCRLERERMEGRTCSAIA
jgi:hypothetical protein